MTLFKTETVDALLTEGQELFKAHYQEVGMGHFPLALNEAAYRKMDEAGLLRVFTAREDKALIGYNVLYISESLHYQGIKQAAQDCIFIHPDHRGFGQRFIAWCDEQLKKDGVMMVFGAVKAKQDFGAILVRQGYTLTDLVYSKPL